MIWRMKINNNTLKMLLRKPKKRKILARVSESNAVDPRLALSKAGTDWRHENPLGNLLIMYRYPSSAPGDSVV